VGRRTDRREGEGKRTGGERRAGEVSEESRSTPPTRPVDSGGRAAAGAKGVGTLLFFVRFRGLPA
jgi:hypothetical protein